MKEDQDVPISSLAGLESPVSGSFLQNFRNKVHRRAAAAQLTLFSLKLPAAIFVEFVNIIVHLFKVVDGKKGRSQ